MNHLIAGLGSRATPALVLGGLTLSILAPGTPSVAQVPPPDFASVELDRSRACVDVLDRLDALDERLAPMAERSQRLLGIAEAVALEERSAVESLNGADPVEGAVLAWFEADSVLAQRFLAEQDSAVLQERAGLRDDIEATLGEAIRAVQAQADSVIASTGTLQADAGRCNGAIFVRGAVLEACGSATSPVCEAARDTTAQPTPFRFVESPEVLWDIQQLRPWTAPTALAVTPDGQLGGARTVGYTRTGNIVVNVTFYPLLRERAQLTPEQLERTEMILDSLGFEASHPDLVFVPALAVQASLPEALGGETSYIVHFGPPDSAEVILSAPAGTGAPIQSVVELDPSSVSRLGAGEPLTLTAIRQTEAGTNEAVFAIELTSVSQGARVGSLAGYMAAQLSGDLERLLPPGNGG